MRLTCFLITLITASALAETDPLAWRAADRNARPWTYWWWPGSAVAERDIETQLRQFKDAGLGGVHIVPIYGSKDGRAEPIDYLSAKWMAMLRFTVSKAAELDMGVDMTLGSGWCFGGPEVTEDECGQKWSGSVLEVKAGAKLGKPSGKGKIVAATAYVNKSVYDLTKQISADGISIDWTAPSDAKVYVVQMAPTKFKVKRPGPGGGGWMIDPFYGVAIDHYLARFTKAFEGYEGPKPRAIYHDSYEYFGCDWSPDLLTEFEKRRGYRLQDHLPEFVSGEGEQAARVKSDYRETVSDLMIERVAPEWIGWGKERGMISRYQAHGSPANLLDLYGVAETPETEMFNKDRDVLVAKFASSAAHVMGRRRTSSETGTWLSEHFHETPGAMKRLQDELFLGGVNHIFYHGTCYSPIDAPWPGWFFYAATQMNPRNSLWRDFSVLNQYVERVQGVLQAGQSDNDVLVYWPIHDLWHEAGGTVMGLTVHHRDWLNKQPIGKTARRLWERGYAFDYVSDRQLKEARSENSGVKVAGGTYRAIVLPVTAHMPVETMVKLAELARNGCAVIFEEKLPADVPGLGKIEERRAKLAEIVKADGAKFHVGDVEAGLAKAGVAREAMGGFSRLEFVRRRGSGSKSYLVVNRTDKAIERFVPLATSARAVGIMDPMTGRTGLGAVRRSGAGCEVYLQLVAGESVILRAFENEVSAEKLKYHRARGESVELKDGWKLEFVEGGPALPKGSAIQKLESWTNAQDAQAFAGTGRYSIQFDAPEPGMYWLDLGQVRESARVKLNGQDVGAALMAPYRVLLNGVKEKANRLDVEVTNLSANRIRDLDVRKVDWKVMKDANIVNIDYKTFDASKWPLEDAGLIGPVKLQRVEAFEVIEQ